MQQGFRIRRQIGVNDQLQPRQVNPARGHIGRNTDVRPAIAQRGQRIGALLLAKFARQSHHFEATIAHPRHQMIDVHPSFTEHDRSLGLIEPQHVENRMFAVAHRHRQRAIFDIDVLLGLALCRDPQRIILEIFRQLCDLFRHGGREHQRAAVFRGCCKDILQIFAEAQIEHLIGFVQHRRAQARQVQRFAVDMVAQAARRADHDMRATVQHALFGAVIHAADAGGNHGTRACVKPFQLARHLQRQFAGRCDHQGQRIIGIQKLIHAAQNLVGNRDPESHGLARTSLRRHQHITALRIWLQHRRLHGGQVFIALSRQSRSQRRGNHLINHIFS